MNRPITIIGGGLSGLALGCILRKHDIPVTIIEQGKYPRHKVCGEFICGVSNETLAELGILELFENAESVRKISWHIADEKVLAKTLPLHGTGISRFLLDDELQKLFTKLGGTIEHTRIDASSPYHAATEGVVWACGKENHSKGNDAQRWLGLKVHLTGMDIEGLEMHTGGSSVKGGYIGLSPIENGKVNLCGLFEVNKDVPGKGVEKIHGYLMSMGLDKLAARLNSATIDHSSFSAVAGFSMGQQKMLDSDELGMLPIGDAAMLIPPFTGNGMSIALETALLAGKTLLPYCRNEKNSDWDKVLKTYLYAVSKTFRKRLIVARFIHPFFFHRSGKNLLRILAKSNLIPFRRLFYLLR